MGWGWRGLGVAVWEGNGMLGGFGRPALFCAGAGLPGLDGRCGP